MNSVRITAKTVDEAVIEGLRQLSIKYDEAAVEIIQESSKGFLGIGAKDAIVNVAMKFDPVRICEDFLQSIFDEMGLSVEIVQKLTDKQLYVNMTGKDMGVLIGKRGQTLDSLQYLVNLVINKSSSSYISVTLDTENYRQRRKETLENLAQNLAKKVKQTRRNVSLEPMNPYERRIIHAVLQNDKLITTYSEGEEPYRNVVIALSTKH